MIQNFELYTTIEEIDYCDYLPSYKQVLPTGFTVDIDLSTLKGYGDLINFEDNIQTAEDLVKFIKEIKKWK